VWKTVQLRGIYRSKAHNTSWKQEWAKEHKCDSGTALSIRGYIAEAGREQVCGMCFLPTYTMRYHPLCMPECRTPTCISIKPEVGGFGRDR
jgi:hypothetical protein